MTAVLLFGSRLVGASPDVHSAHDLVVVVNDYLRFYEALVAAGHHRRSPRFLAGLATVLPPNLIAFFPEGPGGPVAKCMIISVDDFHRALSPAARDHFVKGRMVQRVVVLHARDLHVGARIQEDLALARRDVLRWAGPFVEQPFTAEDLAWRMLDVSYGAEVRPESGSRVQEVFEAQRETLVPAFRDVLERAEMDGEVERTGRGWRFPTPPTGWDRLGLRAYFLASKVRVTLRWFKHVLTFDDWLTYIQRKVERRTGIEVEIGPWERRYPLLFLWPKVVRVLRSRPAEAPSGAVGEGRPEGGGEA